MKNSFLSAVLGVAALVLGSSCDGDEKVIWVCGCEAVCDGMMRMANELVCTWKGEASQAVSDGVEACESELGNGCTESSCACHCMPTGIGGC